MIHPDGVVQADRAVAQLVPAAIEMESPLLGLGVEKPVLNVVVDTSSPKEDSEFAFMVLSVNPHDIPEYPVAEVHHCGPVNEVVAAMYTHGFAIPPQFELLVP